MRIFGDLLLALGIIFLILFVLAEFGGGGMGAVPFIISGVLIVTGANLRSAGGGILRKKPEDNNGCKRKQSGRSGAKCSDSRAGIFRPWNCP